MTMDLGSKQYAMMIYLRPQIEIYLGLGIQANRDSLLPNACIATKRAIQGIIKAIQISLCEVQMDQMPGPI